MTLGVLAAKVIINVSVIIEIDIPLCVGYRAPHEDVFSEHQKEIVIFKIYM
jgi:hypothetical protein